MVIFSRPPKVDPLAVQWRTDGRVIYPVGSNVRVGTARSARVARQIVDTHNATLTTQ